MKELKIKEIRKKPFPCVVYDIEIADVHHYILGNGIISHNSIGGFGGNQIGGGSGSLYNSSIISDFTKAQEKSTDGKTTIGACITATNVKCRTAKEKTKVKFSIDFENGLTLYSGLKEFCLDEKLLVKDGQSFKFNSDLLSSIPMYTTEKFGPSKLTVEFWEQFLQEYLAGYMGRKFKYQSVADEILNQKTEDEFDGEPEGFDEGEMTYE